MKFAMLMYYVAYLFICLIKFSKQTTQISCKSLNNGKWKNVFLFIFIY